MIPAPSNPTPSEGFSSFSGNSPPPVVVLSPEQTAAKMVELRDAEGKSIGYLYREAGVAVYYSPEHIAELQRRAASGERGRTLREVIDSVTQQLAKATS